LIAKLTPPMVANYDQWVKTAFKRVASAALFYLSANHIKFTYLIKEIK